MRTARPVAEAARLWSVFALLAFVLAGSLPAQQTTVLFENTTGALTRPVAATFRSANDIQSASGAAASYQPLSANLTSWAAITRASGFDTFVATPSSANLASLLTNETGTGAAVFANTPTLVTPNIGAATGTSLNLSGGITLGGDITDTGPVTISAVGNVTLSPSAGNVVTTARRLTVTDTTAATNTTSGSATFGGGIGVAGSGWFGGNANFSTAGTGLALSGGGLLTGTSGAVAISAGGTAQSVSIAPSTTGATTISAVEGGARGLVIGSASAAAGFPLRVRLDRAGAVTSDYVNLDSGASSASVINVQAEGGTVSLAAHSASHSIWPDTGLVFANSLLSGGLAVGTGTTAPVTFHTNNSERVRISDTGLRVGTGGTHTDLIVSATATVDYTSIAAGAEQTQTITVTGAAVGDSVSVGWGAVLPDGIVVKQYWVSATNTVSIRVRNETAGAIDPASQTVRATVISF